MGGHCALAIYRQSIQARTQTKKLVCRRSFVDELELPEIDEKDIAYSSCRSSGKGGQNINKVETAVRATHIPTGTSVRCSDERSQFQNRNKARERLLLKLLAMQDDAKNVKNKENWNRHDSLVRGNPVKKFSGSL